MIRGQVTDIQLIHAIIRVLPSDNKSMFGVTSTMSNTVITPTKKKKKTCMHLFILKLLLSNLLVISLSIL